MADGSVVACLDVLQITHAAISMVELLFSSCKLHFFFFAAEHLVYRTALNKNIII